MATKFKPAIGRTASPNAFSTSLFFSTFAQKANRTQNYRKWSENATVVRYDSDNDSYDIVITVTQGIVNNQGQKNSRTMHGVRSILPTNVHQFKEGERVLIGYINERRESPVILGLRRDLGVDDGSSDTGTTRTTTVKTDVIIPISLCTSINYNTSGQKYYIKVDGTTITASQVHVLADGTLVDNNGQKVSVLSCIPVSPGTTLYVKKGDTPTFEVLNGIGPYTWSISGVPPECVGDGKPIHLDAIKPDGTLAPEAFTTTQYSKVRLTVDGYAGALNGIAYVQEGCFFHDTPLVLPQRTCSDGCTAKAYDCNDVFVSQPYSGSATSTYTLPDPCPLSIDSNLASLEQQILLAGFRPEAIKTKTFSSTTERDAEIAGDTFAWMQSTQDTTHEGAYATLSTITGVPVATLQARRESGCCPTALLDNAVLTVTDSLGRSLSTTLRVVKN